MSDPCDHPAQTMSGHCALCGKYLRQSVLNGNSGICVLCDEAIEPGDAWTPLNPAQYAHHECALREVVGGIGHQIAHNYWCVDKRDPDAGLTFRQSARMVVALVDVLGIEAVSKRGVVQ